MNAWSHLPNAHHIDRVLESVKSHPEIWDAFWGVARNAAWSAALNAAWSTAYDAARSAARWAAWLAAWDAALSVTLHAARDMALDAAWDAARNAIAALIAYDDGSKYLDMPSDHLRIWAIISEDPAAILLLPAVIAFERINELECV
jgi:hypothetical protein